MNLQCSKFQELELELEAASAQSNSMYSMHGRDPTDQQRSWLVSKTRTDIAMMEINLQNMHEKSLPPTGLRLGARKRMELEM
jgi:hypothetical protein